MKSKFVERIDLAGLVIWLPAQENAEKAEELAKKIKERVTKGIEGFKDKNVKVDKGNVLKALATYGFELIYNPFNGNYSLRPEKGSYAEKYFNFADVMTFAEASEKYDVAVSTLRHRQRDGRFQNGDTRKSGSIWLVTYEAMRRLYGDKK